MSIPITDKYLLYKPGLGNEADIRVLNHNTDNIDNGMYQNRRMIGDTYNPESTAEHPYMKGDLVVKQTTILDENDNPVSYSFQYCKCLQDNTYGPWDPTKWQQTDVATELKSGGGGASSLSDLTDTDIDSPAEGEVLTYDGENWVNAEGSASVTKEASGNPIEVSDSASAPLVKCVSAITGSQDLHGQDKPWVGGAGKNKLNPFAPVETFDLTGEGVYRYGISFEGNKTYTIVSNTSSSTGFYYRTPKSDLSDRGTSVQIPTNGYVTVVVSSDCILWLFTSSASIWETYVTDFAVNIGNDTDFTPYSNICPITAYTEGEIVERGKNIWDESYPNISSNLIYLPLFVGNGTFTLSTTTPARSGNTANLFLLPGNVDSGASSAYSGAYQGKSVTDTAIDGYVTIAYRDTEIDPRNYKTQLEKGSTATTYEPYKGVTHTTTYSSAIYRGSEDVVGGEVTSEWVKVVFDGSSDESWYQHNTYNTQFGINVDGLYLGIDFEGQGYTNDLISNYYDCLYSPATTRANGTLSCYEGTFGNQQGGKWFAIRDDRFTSLSDFKTWLASNPLEIAYKRITKTDTVTPTNLPIKSLNGYNHIESSTGDMEIEYITQGMQPIIDLIGGGTYVTPFIDTSNVIVPKTGLPSATFEYTATQDCWLYVDLGGNSQTGKVYIDNQEVFFSYCVSFHNNGGCLVPLKKGQVAKIEGRVTNDEYAVYGCITDSIGSGSGGSGSSSIHVYSTDEQIVGKWIDGKTVYEKTLYYSSLSAAHNNWASLETMSIGQLLNVEVSFKDSGGRQLDEQYLRVSYYNGSLYYHTPETSGTCTDIYITIQYTKPSNNRSLNLSKGEISGEKKKVDETPIEEEKPVENDLDEWLEESDEIEEEVDEGTDEDSDVIEEEEENEATNE